MGWFCDKICSVITGGHGCTAYDVVIHPDFFEKMKDSDVFRTFFMSVTMEGLEEKYSITLSRGESCNERELLSGHFSFAIKAYFLWDGSSQYLCFIIELFWVVVFMKWPLNLNGVFSTDQSTSCSENFNLV